MAADFPNVTFLHIRRIVEQITAVLERLGLGVRILGSFTILAGVAILGGAVSAGTVRRSREVALLKTLGMTRRGVVAVFSTEYALLGLVAGIIGSLGGGVLAWAVLTRVLDLTWTSRPLAQIVAVGATVALAVIAGLASSTRALTQRPVEVLREE
jgi:putative ABC transport system permease protein